jgi:IclR family acetate operon transcriptional repressor
MRVVEAVAHHNGAVGVGELSRIVDLPKSTVQRILRSLAEAGWVQPTDDAVTRWKLGGKISALARHGAERADLRQTALTFMRNLGGRTGETIHLIVPAPDGLVVLIERVDSTQPVRTYNEIGATSAIHATAGGKVILARTPDDELETFLARPLQASTPNTYTDPGKVREQVMEARARGYAVNLAENRAGVCAIGAPVVVGNRAVAAVVISMPDSRFEPSRVDEWGRLAIDCANSIAGDLTV